MDWREVFSDEYHILKRNAKRFRRTYDSENPVITDIGQMKVQADMSCCIYINDPEVFDFDSFVHHLEQVSQQPRFRMPRYLRSMVACPGEKSEYFVRFPGKRLRKVTLHEDREGERVIYWDAFGGSAIAEVHRYPDSFRGQSEASYKINIWKERYFLAFLEHIEPFLHLE